MRIGKLVMLAMLVLSTAARAQEDDDDPKAKPAVSVKKPKSEAAKADARPVKPKTLPETKPEAKTDAKRAESDKPKALPQAKPDAKRAESDKPKALPKPPVEREATREPIKDVDAPGPPKIDKPRAPKLARASEAEVVPPAPPLGDPAPPRSVRVRLLDGSTVVGSVHAEQTDALIIDCSLGQLAIPRTRISTIAYDAAAGIGSKRAPVQQLDDDAPAPTTKRRVINP